MQKSRLKLQEVRSHQGNPLFPLVLEYLQACYEEEKEAAVSCRREDVDEVRGAARKLKALVDELTPRGPEEGDEEKAKRRRHVI